MKKWNTSPVSWLTKILIFVGCFVAAHGGIFLWHEYLTFRYQTLIRQASDAGTIVTMTPEQHSAIDYLATYTLLTRTDIVWVSNITMQDINARIIEQYRSDFYRMHELVVGDLQSLRTMATEEDFVFSEKQSAHTLMISLEQDLEKSQHVADLRDTYTRSHPQIQSLQTLFQIEYRLLTLTDILALKREIMLMDSVFRFFPSSEREWQYEDIMERYVLSFSRDVLVSDSPEKLTTLLREFSQSLDVFRKESDTLRRAAREKRQDLVKKETEKWHNLVPRSPTVGHAFSLVEVDIASQKMYLYEDSELILSTPITSGRRDFETVKGTFKIYNKKRGHLMRSPFEDEDYELWVDYWMPFHEAYGLHDACNSRDCWRTKFGWRNYLANGSHGCINTPYNAIKFLFNWAKIGTTVHVE